MAGVTIAMIVSLLPIGSYAYTNSKEVLRIWDIAANESQNRLTVKTIHGMRPFRVYSGINELHFYMLDETVLRTYVASILDWTITLLMTFKQAR